MEFNKFNIFLENLHQPVDNVESFVLKFQGEWQEYGIDWDGPVPEEPVEDDISVEVPETSNPLSDEQFQELSNRINPLRISNNYGIDIYLEVVSFVVNGLRDSQCN